MNSIYRNREYRLIKGLFFIMPFLWGLYYEYAVYTVEAVLWICMLVRMMKKRKIVFLTGFVPFFLSLFIGMSILSLFWSIDTGMACGGVLKFLIIIPFLYLVSDYTELQREELFRLIPVTGSMMTVCCCVAYFTPMKELFFKAERLGGFFQYSNTFALYLLVGLVVLFGIGQKRGKKELLEAGILLIGIFLTGSRSVFILLCIYMLIFVWKYRKTKQGKLVLGGSLLCISGIGVALLVTGNSQLFGRFLTISWKNSTFLGRLLYYKDALGMLLKHPFGLGFQGYSYVHPYEQSGVYNIRYVHNDWLQLALDVGIIMLLLAVVVFVMCLMDKQLNKHKKYILLCIGVHAFFDFDLQFIVILFILLLCMNYDKIGRREVTFDQENPSISQKKVHVMSKVIGCGYALLSLTCIVLTVSFGMAHVGQYDTALALYPFHTQAKIDKMKKTEDFELMQEVIEDNAYVSDAYRLLAKYYYEQKDYDKMLIYERKWLEGCRYDMQAYEECMLSVSSAIEETIKKEGYEQARVYIEFALELDKQLEATKEQTSSLAWMIKDQPELTWSENFQNYIQILKKTEGN